RFGTPEGVKRRTLAPQRAPSSSAACPEAKPHAIYQRSASGQALRGATRQEIDQRREKKRGCVGNLGSL
ncbi:MAG TPA: hypothetical protein VF294_06880, partial [Polyangiaceae bacterium]